MLNLTIPALEAYDEQKGEFVEIKETSLSLEHSLISLSKWESKWNIPFLDNRTPKTVEQTIDYIRCMTITQNVNPEAYNYLSESDISKIKNYIDSPMTATTFSQKPSGGRREIVTAELIYYWMVSFNIPFECQKWHLNRLLTLINVCSIKNAPPKKMSKNEIRSRNAALNAARRKQLNSLG